MTELSIREATVQDAGLLLDFIRRLARYERAEDEVVATVEDIELRLFTGNSSTKALICNAGSAPIGVAIYFFTFSTWLGKESLFLEDLFVLPSHRGAGAGKMLLQRLAQVAVESNCGRFEWNVLDWNEPAIKFYESLGAKAQSEWVSYRLEGECLRELARRQSS